MWEYSSKQGPSLMPPHRWDTVHARCYHKVVLFAGNTLVHSHTCPPVSNTWYTNTAMSHAHIHTILHTNTWLCTQSGSFALHAAVENEHEDIVELLLEANADPNLQLKVSHVTVLNVKYRNTTSYTIASFPCQLFPYETENWKRELAW